MSISGLCTNKSDTLSADLEKISLETIDKLYPENDWLRIYNESFAIPTTGHTGADLFCSLFEGSVAVGKPSINFDGEILAISYKIPISHFNLVFLAVSQAAISEMCSDNAMVAKGREELAELYQRGHNVILQWIPSHVGFMEMI